MDLLSTPGASACALWPGRRFQDTADQRLIYQLGFQLRAAGCDSCWEAAEMHHTALNFLLRKVQAEIRQPQHELKAGVTPRCKCSFKNTKNASDSFRRRRNPYFLWKRVPPLCCITVCFLNFAKVTVVGDKSLFKPGLSRQVSNPSGRL